MAWITRQRARIGAAAFAAGAVALGVWLRTGPLPAGLLDDELKPSTLVVDRRGEVLYEVRSASGLRSDDLDVLTLPPALVAATLAAEDVRFRWHPGLDPIGIARATIHNLRAGQVVEGGSTITQQVAKILIARQAGRVDRGWRAKLGEAVVALRLEHRLTKNEIVALYLNLAPYGNQIQGASRASTVYFGRNAASLTTAEAALLAALPQQPSRFNPWKHPERPIARQRAILETMAARGWIDQRTAEAARTERIVLTGGTPRIIAPHFVERVLATLGRQRPKRVETTLDAALQRDVHGIIAAQAESLRAHHASNVAVAVLDNHTGDWLAWEGSGDYFDAANGGAIDGVVSPRQPGSALKPFTYAAAFERGTTPGHALADVPSQFPTAEPGILYSPRNYDGRYRGPLLARAALAGSENVPAVALASEIGVPAVLRLLRRAGFTTLDNNAAHYGLGLTLGNAEVRLSELVAGYAMFARGGVRVSPRLVTSVNGVAKPGDSIAERVVSDRTAFWITDILSDAEARAYIFGRGGSLEFPFPVAAKTGTSQSYFDNWVVGYTRDVTVGVWVGNFDRTPLRGSSGVTGAGPIFHAVMLAAVERVAGSLPIDDTRPIIEPPADVARVDLCAMSGQPAGDACPTRVSEWMPTSAETSGERCTWHHASDEGLVTVFPPAYEAWARSEGLLARRASSDAASATPFERAAAPARRPADRARAAADTGALTIARPLGGAVFLFDPTLRPEFQSLALSARGGQPGLLDWYVDGEHAGRSQRDDSVRWPLVRGRHEVLVRDAAGNSAMTHIEVR